MRSRVTKARGSLRCQVTVNGEPCNASPHKHSAKSTKNPIPHRFGGKDGLLFAKEFPVCESVDCQHDSRQIVAGDNIRYWEVNKHTGQRVVCHFDCPDPDPDLLLGPMTPHMQRTFDGIRAGGGQVTVVSHDPFYMATPAGWGWNGRTTFDALVKRKLLRPIGNDTWEVA